MKDFLTRKEVADLLSVSTLTVSNLNKSGRLPYFKIGRAVRIAGKDLNDYLTATAAGAKAAPASGLSSCSGS